jgi:hypothetical protein
MSAEDSQVVRKGNGQPTGGSSRAYLFTPECVGTRKRREALAREFILPNGTTVTAVDVEWGTDSRLGNVVTLITRKRRIKVFRERNSDISTFRSQKLISLERKLKSLITHPEKNPGPIRLDAIKLPQGIALVE